MKARKSIICAAVLAGLALSANVWAGLGNTDDPGRPDWAGNGNGATFSAVTDTTADPMLSIFTLTTPSGNVKTTTLSYTTNGAGQQTLLSMQKQITNHNGNTVDIDRVFSLVPEPADTSSTVTVAAGGTQAQ